MKERHGSTFTAECHVRYLREIHLGDPVQIFGLAAGGRRQAAAHVRGDAARDRRLAVGDVREHVAAHGHERAAALRLFRRTSSERIAAVAKAHSAVPRPEGIGRNVAMPSKRLRIIAPLDPVAAAGAAPADHGRDQEQDDRDEEDDLGDLDRSAGDAAEAQNTGDQCDNQKCHNPAQACVKTSVLMSVSRSARLARASPATDNLDAGTMVPARCKPEIRTTRRNKLARPRTWKTSSNGRTPHIGFNPC